MPAKQQAEDREDGGQRALGVPDCGLAKGGDAVADRLDAGHGGAAAGERSHEHPDAEAGDGGRERGGGREAVEADGGDAGDDADLLFGLLVGRQASPE
jgi:hypothetical protein